MAQGSAGCIAVEGSRAQLVGVSVTVTPETRTGPTPTQRGPGGRARPSEASSDPCRRDEPHAAVGLSRHVHAIGRRRGPVSVGLIYQYFGNKEDLLRGVVVDILEDFRDAIPQALAKAGEDPVERQASRSEPDLPRKQNASA